MGTDDTRRHLRRKNQCRSIASYVFISSCVIATLLFILTFVRSNKNNTFNIGTRSKSPTISKRRKGIEPSLPRHLRRTEKTNLRSKGEYRTSLLGKLTTATTNDPATIKTSSTINPNTSTTETTTISDILNAQGPLPNDDLPKTIERVRSNVATTADPPTTHLLFADRLKKAAKSFIGQSRNEPQKSSQNGLNKSEQQNIDAGPTDEQPADNGIVAHGKAANVFTPKARVTTLIEYNTLSSSSFMNDKEKLKKFSIVVHSDNDDVVRGTIGCHLPSSTI